MTLNDYAAVCHAANKKWWQNPETGAPITRNKGELIALMHSEVSECADGEYECAMDDKLPHRSMAEVECADTLIRIFDYSGGFRYDLNSAALKIGLSEFIDLNHISQCAMKFDADTEILNRRTEFIHSKLSRLLEHERKGRVDEVPGALVECIVCISIYAFIKSYDIQGAYQEKMAYNATRKDHTHEARRIAGGKQF